MKKTTQARESADNRSAGVVTRGAPPGVGPVAPYIRGLLRFARLRSRGAVARKDGGDIPPRGGGPDHGSDAARASMDAGLTRGASLLFGEFGRRR